MVEGVIFAGGGSTRMNGDMKALLPIGGEAMVERIARRMRVICRRITIIVGTESQADALSHLGLPMLMDKVQGQGPLAAFHTALSGSVNPDAIWVSACDMPFVSEAAAAWMAGIIDQTGAMAVIPETNGQLHPLQAVYRRGCREEAAACLTADKRGMKHLLSRIDYLTLNEEQFRKAGIDPCFTVNVNTPAEYALALRMEGLG